MNASIFSAHSFYYLFLIFLHALYPWDYMQHVAISIVGFPESPSVDFNSSNNRSVLQSRPCLESK
jgi:hypothetical protein